MNPHQDRRDAEPNATVGGVIVSQECGAVNAHHQPCRGRAGAADGPDGGAAVHARPGAGTDKFEFPPKLSVGMGIYPVFHPIPSCGEVVRIILREFPCPA